MDDPPTSPRITLQLALLVCVVVAVSGCKSTSYAEKADDVVDAPDQQESSSVEGLVAQRWCSDFGQPGLDAMVERAWSENMELKAAWARLEQAQAVADIASASLLPTAEAGAGVEYSNGDFRGGIEGDSGGSGAELSWELSAAAAYEVDIWGRHRHRARAADIEAEATEQRARALAITLTSQVAEAWFDVVAHRQRVELLQTQLEASEDILAITRERLRRGLARAVDAAQQEQNVESLRGELATARGLLKTSQHRLAVLVGEAPSDEDYVAAAELPDVEPIADAGVPADLLERRPDVRAAYLMLEAADQRTAAAVADRLPRLRLSASLGFQAQQLASLFDQILWSIGAGVSQSLFEGGRLQAEVERSEAVAEERLYGYANTLLVAMREVRDALVLEQTQLERIESLEREVVIARSVLELSRDLYRNGSEDYLRVLTGLRALQEVERALLEARRQQISYRISLCRSLGGSWVESVESSIDNDERE